MEYIRLCHGTVKEKTTKYLMKIKYQNIQLNRKIVTNDLFCKNVELYEVNVMYVVHCVHSSSE